MYNCVRIVVKMYRIQITQFSEYKNIRKVIIYIFLKYHFIMTVNCVHFIRLSQQSIPNIGDWYLIYINQITQSFTIFCYRLYYILIYNGNICTYYRYIQVIGTLYIYTLKAISNIYLECICCLFTYLNMFYIAADTKLKYDIHKGP